MGAFSLPTTGPASRAQARNPYLDEIDAAAQNAHTQLSPGAQKALQLAGAPLPQQAQAPAPIGGPSAPPPPLASPATFTERPGASIPAAPIVAPPPKAPGQVAAEGEFGRLTAPDTGMHNRQNTGTAGVNQIKSPWARVPLQIASALAETFAPRLATAIPGTESHHQYLVGQQENAIRSGEESRKAEGAVNLGAAQTNEANARAYDLEHKDLPDQTPKNAFDLFMKDPAAFQRYQQAVAKATETKEPQFVKDGEGNLVGLIDPQGKLHSAADPNLDPQAKAIMEAAKPKAPTTPAGTTDMQNYEFAKKNGYAGSFVQWQTDEANRHKPATAPGGGKTLPLGAVNQLEKKVGMAQTTARLAETFKDAYAGNTITGGAENFLGRMGWEHDPGQSQWWQDYQDHKNNVRHELFGGALTPNEQAQFEKQDINPRMDPGQIRQNLKRQHDIVQGALDRLVKVYGAGGYNPEQLNEYKSQEPPSGNGPPEVGGTFNGGKVLKVTRIK